MSTSQFCLRFSHIIPAIVTFPVFTSFLNSFSSSVHIIYLKCPFLFVQVSLSSFHFKFNFRYLDVSGHLHPSCVFILPIFTSSLFIRVVPAQLSIIIPTILTKEPQFAPEFIWSPFNVCSQSAHHVYNLFKCI